jgi:hypothetical protein
MASSLDCRHITGDVGFSIKRRLLPVQVPASSHDESIGFIGVGRYPVWPADLGSQQEKWNGSRNVRFDSARTYEYLPFANQHQAACSASLLLCLGEKDCTDIGDCLAHICNLLGQ